MRKQRHKKKASSGIDWSWLKEQAAQLVRAVIVALVLEWWKGL